jgi:hypothetical protein
MVEEFERLKGIYKMYDVYLEPEPRVWGYEGRQSFYNEDEAQSKADELSQDKRTRRVTVEHSEWSGMWEVKWDSTRKPKGEGVSAYRTRIARARGV